MFCWRYYAHIKLKARIPPLGPVGSELVGMEYEDNKPGNMNESERVCLWKGKKMWDYIRKCREIRR